ncbi:hypothetical protein ACJMK2_013940 [Sinanodonta woodiana]|uniref:RIIa domain-containing protein n=1 Tax=Sinanodonta woodiana TaxID=1069815 RepID=A0ABD3V0B3_SINWO
MAEKRKPSAADEIQKETERQFLDRSGVAALYKDVLEKIIANRPEDPVAFLADYFDSVEENTSLIQRAEQIMKMTHHSRPLFQTNVRMAYDLLKKNKANKKLSGVNGTMFTQLLKALCRDIPSVVMQKLMQKYECHSHEAIPFDVFRSGVFTCCVLQDYVKLSEQLFGSLDLQRTGKANKALCDAVLEQLNTALGSNRNDPKRILESGYNLGVDGLYMALDNAMGRSHKNSTLQTCDQFLVEMCETFLSKVSVIK